MILNDSATDLILFTFLQELYFLKFYKQQQNKQTKLFTLVNLTTVAQQISKKRKNTFRGMEK